MTTLQHLNRERERHGLLTRKCLPHMFLVRQQLLARHHSTFRLGLFPLVEENWHGTNLFRAGESEFFPHACAGFLAKSLVDVYLPIY
jgi:hypothetical protein